MNALSSPNATGSVARQNLYQRGLHQRGLHQRSLYPRSTFLVLLLALVSFVLTACSVDISTTQKMDSKGKGTRTMTAVVEVEDDDAAKLDAKKVDKSLKKAAPKGTKVTSVKKKGDKLTIKVEMSFKDIDEYKGVLSHALKAGDHNADSLEVEFRAIEGPLREDVLLKENASSRQLLDWMGKALIKDKLLAKKELEKFRVEDRGGTLDIGKSSFKDSRTPFFESKRIEHGFTSIRPLIEIKPEGYRVAVSYEMSTGARDKEKVRTEWIDCVMPFVSDPDGTYRPARMKESEEKELGFTHGASFLVLAEVSGEKRFRAVAEKSAKLSSFTAVLKPGAGDAVSFGVEVGVAVA
ncbi:hypothetical protein QP116_05650 [Pseudoglutamicibacter cumminsii]|uniref:Uncharacterized protein n=2 Tax=Pseudoglutamicibacter cumminsii TaxID=156979 RepID=A0AAP4FDK7_9MICC|nr:hypothetical protein [Pseudoglutamicibacter cumminsii]MDK6275219.1 hypothetical protein [Pseudoglutamicibacter cumminsii]